jgi:hypothetical protein
MEVNLNIYINKKKNQTTLKKKKKKPFKINICMILTLWLDLLVTWPPFPNFPKNLTNGKMASLHATSHLSAIIIWLRRSFKLLSLYTKSSLTQVWLFQGQKVELMREQSPSLYWI